MERLVGSSIHFLEKWYKQEKKDKAQSASGYDFCIALVSLLEKAICI